MRLPLLLSALSFSLLTACTGAESGDLSQRNEGHGGDEDCECKIEGEAIGRVGAYVNIGGEIYSFESWQPKPGSAGEYIGFTLSANAASAEYVVKAATESYAGSGTSWTHPDGDGAHAISNVDFCEDPPPDDPPPPPPSPDID